MNKKLNYLKNILLIINLIECIFLIKMTTLYGLKIIIYILLLLYLIYISYKDLSCKVNLSNKYYILFCIVELVINFILARALFDPNINFFKNNLTEIEKYTTSVQIYINQLLYFLQNFYYILILYVSLLIYHHIETKGVSYDKFKFSRITLICLFINILLVVPTLSCVNFGLTNKIIFIIAEIILISTEIFMLIKNNGKKYEWPIYVSFLFNLFAIIFLIISFIIY